MKWKLTVNYIHHIGYKDSKGNSVTVTPELLLLKAIYGTEKDKITEVIEEETIFVAVGNSQKQVLEEWDNARRNISVKKKDRIEEHMVKIDKGRVQQYY